MNTTDNNNMNMNNNMNNNMNTTDNNGRPYRNEIIEVNITVSDNSTIEGYELGKEFANCLFLGKIQHGTKNTYLKGIAVTDLRKLDAVHMVQHLLYALLAEYKQRQTFINEHGKFSTPDNLTHESGVRALNLLKTYLNTSVIYRTNIHGVISAGIQLTHNMKLKDTALKITDRHFLATCKKEYLKPIIHQHAKAVCAQFRYITDINEIMQKLASEATTTTATAKAKTAKATKAKTTTAKVTTAKVTAPAPATTTTATAIQATI